MSSEIEHAKKHELVRVLAADKEGRAETELTIHAHVKKTSDTAQ